MQEYTCMHELTSSSFLTHTATAMQSSISNMFSLTITSVIAYGVDTYSSIYTIILIFCTFIYICTKNQW